MNKGKASKELMESFIRMVHQYKALEKYPMNYGTKHEFYHSERHILDVFGDNPDKNMSEMANMIGVTKGAISQFVAKLEKKGALRRYREPGNDKEIRVELTPLGRDIYRKHQAVNQETVFALLKELQQQSPDKIEFLLRIFRWLEEYLETSRTHMDLQNRDTK